jgi:hypothetical protein
MYKYIVHFDKKLDTLNMIVVNQTCRFPDFKTALKYVNDLQKKSEFSNIAIKEIQ